MSFTSKIDLWVRYSHCDEPHKYMLVQCKQHSYKSFVWYNYTRARKNWVLCDSFIITLLNHPNGIPMREPMTHTTPMIFITFIVGMIRLIESCAKNQTPLLWSSKSHWRESGTELCWPKKKHEALIQCNCMPMAPTIHDRINEKSIKFNQNNGLLSSFMAIYIRAGIFFQHCIEVKWIGE